MKVIRFVLVVFTCGILLFSSAAPAAAISASAPSATTEGEAQLDDVYNQAKDTVKSNPLPDENDQRKVGATDVNVAQQGKKGKLNTPANSKGAQTVEQSIEEVLEDVLP